ncbi:MAG TPA: hypothetical protein PLU64_01475 [Saprospiraceae bacterium]|nr:hypothetical protein [Lewinellaceae bacterium]HQU57824.1 hypothetical protein [Saprospiraceae bacterium]
MLNYLHLSGIIIVFLLGSTGVQAQEKIDFIYLLNEKVIEGKVESIEGKFVQYIAYENPESQMLRLAKTEIDRVKMADGTEIWFNRLPKMEEPEKEPVAAPTDKKERKKKRPVSAQKLIRQH